MNNHTQLTTEWELWIQSNLDKGCDETSLIHEMVKANFDPVVAGVAVLQAPVSYTHLTLATKP
jgi:hypothetical protein